MRERPQISMVVWLFVAFVANCTFGDIDPNLAGWWRFDDGGGGIEGISNTMGTST